MAKKLKITQVRSAIDRNKKQKRTLVALGIHRMHDSVVHEATPQILGMVKSIEHLLKVEEVD